DSGVLDGRNVEVRVEDTQRPAPGLIVHYGTVVSGAIGVGEDVAARVDAERRRDIMRNHTATHLLHRALRDVLGEHAAQAGSLVAPERLRFDFSHPGQVTPEQQREVERRINAWIRADTPVEWEIAPYQEALARGAMALFGEKYGDRVRMVTVGCADAQGSGIGDRGSGIEDASPTPDPRSLTPGVMCSRELCGGTHVARTGEI